ncbi:MAG TPA: PAS domain-containing protein [Verrucomicrobiae bacterium]|nr:PAS domain-containing protein [Verrucomicrobiae bacterium]
MLFPTLRYFGDAKAHGGGTMKPGIIKVLLVEDNPGDARLLRAFLEDIPNRELELTLTTRLQEALTKLDQADFDIVITDLSLPDSSGLDGFKKLHAAAPKCPFIVLSGIDDESLALGAVREGAQDYLVKSRLDPHLLDRSIRYAIERNRAEDKLITSEAFYHSLVEHLPQNIFRKDLEERFTFANQRFCQLLGKPLEEIIGRTDFDFYPPSLAAKYQQDDQYVISTGKPFEVTEENIAPNGEKMYVHVVKTPIRNAKGQVLGTQCIFWDITERKRFEEQLQLKNAQLATNAEALRRSHEELKAAQLQLIQAEKMESIGTLAAGVAHEVKNPLAILQMGVNYLGKKAASTDENIAMVLQEMRDAIQRADTITRGLLDFAASKKLNVTPHQLNSLIADTLKMVRHELSKKEIRLVTEYADSLPKVAVDRTQIQQVFVNIFVNAAHAMTGGGTLTVRTAARQMASTTLSEGSRSAERMWVGDTAVVAEVEDTGQGIPEENLARIFDPFFTTKPTGVGTGLGLPVTKKIIELHGGTIEIKNKPGGGGVRVTLLLKPAKETN